MVEFSQIWTSGSEEFPQAADAAALASRWDQWTSSGARHVDSSIGEFVRSARADPTAACLLEAVFGNSPYLSQCLLNELPFARELLADGPESAMTGIIADMEDRTRLGLESRSELMVRMRIGKRRFAAAAAMADIANCRDVMSLAAQLSRFACSCLEASAAALLRAAHDRGKLRLPCPDRPTTGSGLILLGMGKLGAGELNFSSDIDIITLFDEHAADVESGGHQQLFSRMARNIVELMARRTAEGYVFRTDLRLRPDPAATPPAISVKAAAIYYRTIGQTWERAAMIKARPVAGDIAAGNDFLAANAGFVWRRNLDFAAVRDIQSVKRQIDAHKGGTGIAVEGQNVKLGQGGIREIEFYTQTQQLIWGGQSQELRGRNTLDMMALLAARGRISETAAADLADAYVYLRRLEHRLQMVDDQQTHSLPATADGVARVATFLGYTDAEAFRRQLVHTLETVKLHYDEVLGRKHIGSAEFALDFRTADTEAQATEIFRSHGFVDPGQAWQTVHRWLSARTLATRGERAAMVLAEITPRLLVAIANSTRPDVTLARFDSFLGQVARSINLLEMLSAQPPLCELISEIMSAAPRLSGWLRQEPGLLESVLQSDFTDLELPDDLGFEDHIVESARRGLVRVHYQLEFRRQELETELSSTIERELQTGFGMQTVLDAQRIWARNRKFQIGVHMLRGYLSAAEASGPLCAIAETCLRTLMPAIKREFAERHGSIDGGRLAIIACGKLGSREMTVTSDLDLIFVYSHPRQAQASDGAKPLSPTQYYAKLCRRFINGVTAPTAQGHLYDVDMRLRPSGKSGPIACSIERFEKYQLSEAWTWEHQALTRARIIYAEGELADRLDDLITRVLTRRRESKSLAEDIHSMRQRIRNEMGARCESTIKHRRGGILDAEFIAQFIQLAHASDHPEILRRDAHSVLVRAGELNLVNSTIARQLAEDILFWRNLQGMLLLALEGDQTEDDVTKILGNSFGIKSQGIVFSSFAEAVDDTAARVAGNFSELLAAGD